LADRGGGGIVDAADAKAAVEVIILLLVVVKEEDQASDTEAPLPRAGLEKLNDPSSLKRFVEDTGRGHGPECDSALLELKFVGSLWS